MSLEKGAPSVLIAFSGLNASSPRVAAFTYSVDLVLGANSATVVSFITIKCLTATVVSGTAATLGASPSLAMDAFYLLGQK